MSKPWIYIRIGKIVGLLQPDVYELFLAEWERLNGITGSEKLTPNFEVMVINSANTPGGSLI